MFSPFRIKTKGAGLKFMKTAAAYIRVSTDMQTEYSPDSQLKLIKDYTDKNNLILTEIYSDEGTPYGGIPKSPQMPIISGFVGFSI